MPIKVCMTGATGYLGGHLAKLLVRRGDQVSAACRDPGELSREQLPGVEPVRADLLDGASLRRAMAGAEIVFQCAGYVSGRDHERCWQVNAGAARTVVEAAAAAGVRRVVLTSSVLAIGPFAATAIGSEAELFRRPAYSLTYAETKHEGEFEALRAGMRLGVELVVVNPAYVLGPPNHRDAARRGSTLIVGQYLRGRLPAIFDGQTNIVDVRDAAAGHVLAAEHGQTGERYVLGGHNLAWAELIARIAELSGVHHPTPVLSPRLVGVLRAAEALGGRLPVPAESLSLMAADTRYSSDHAEQALGYRVRPLDSTLRDTIAWYAALDGTDARRGERSSTLGRAAAGLRWLQAAGALKLVGPLERRFGRRLLTGLG